MDPAMLVECTACHAKRSREASKCPACGHPNERFTRQLWLVVAVLLVAAAALWGWRVHELNQPAASADLLLMDPLLKQYQAGSAKGQCPEMGRRASQLAALALQTAPAIARCWHA